MLLSYFKIAWRNLLRDRIYSAVNVFGLTLGFAGFIFITLYTWHERSYENFHQKADRIARVYQDNNGEGLSAHTFFPVGYYMENDFSDQIANFVRLRDVQGARFASPETSDKNFGGAFYFVDTTYFQTFTHEWRQGDPNTALDEPKCVVLTESLAQNVFGTIDALGKTVEYQNLGGGEKEIVLMKVTGVVSDPPDNTHLPVEAFISMNTIKESAQWSQGNWWYPNCYTYIELKEGKTLADLEAQMPAFCEERLPDQMKGQRMFYLQAIADIHLQDQINHEPTPTANLATVNALSVISVFLLAIACINYMNLATARAAKRSKEIGVKKVVGATKSDLVVQFLGESLIYVTLSLVLAVAFVEAGMGAFNALTGKSLSFQFGFAWAPGFLLVLAGLVAGVSLLAGSYPAFVLSSFQPVTAIKGQSGYKGVTLRKGLVLVQFAISIGMIAATFVVYNQLVFMQNKDLGFDREQLLEIDMKSQKVVREMDVIREELLQSPAIEQVSTHSSVVDSEERLWAYNVEPEGMEDALQMNLFFADRFAYDALGLRVKEGRYYQPGDSAKVVINEATCRQLGWPVEEAVGKKFGVGIERGFSGEVIGVIEDFHFRDVRKAIDPVALVFEEDYHTWYHYDYAAPRPRPSTGRAGTCQSCVRAAPAR